MLLVLLLVTAFVCSVAFAILQGALLASLCAWWKKHCAATPTGLLLVYMRLHVCVGGCSNLRSVPVWVCGSVRQPNCVAAAQVSYAADVRWVFAYMLK